MALLTFPAVPGRFARSFPAQRHHGVHSRRAARGNIGGQCGHGDKQRGSSGNLCRVGYADGVQQCVEQTCVREGGCQSNSDPAQRQCETVKALPQGRFFRTLREGVRTMASLDWSQCPAVGSIPGKVSGAWVLRGTRMPVAAIFENIEAGANIDDIMEWFDGLDREHVKAVIAFAVRSLDKEPAYVP